VLIIIQSWVIIVVWRFYQIFYKNPFLRIDHKYYFVLICLFLIECTPFLFFRIKADDRLIEAEGVESLSEAELREECRERGMLGDLSVEEMRQQVFS
jgi:hypothetical protein